MVRIKKSATARHEPTLSTVIAEFAKATTTIPLYQLPAHLISFPRHWPFPRGDLYHWINVLNRFDSILELFVEEYALSKGPQIESFGRRLLLKGEGAEPTPSSLPTSEILDDLGFSQEGDRELVESLISFTRLLLENCGNRNLYASSARLNDLLNTSSLSLLKATLRLTLRLAQRYHATRTRMQSNSLQNHILATHYALNLENLTKIAAPFPKKTSAPAPLFGSPAPSKSKEAADDTDNSSNLRNNPANFVQLLKPETSPRSLVDAYGGVGLTYYESDPSSGPVGFAEGSAFHQQQPSTPTPIRRTSNLGPNTTPRQTRGVEQSSPLGTASPLKQESASTTAMKVLEISPSKLTGSNQHDLLKQNLQIIPEHYHFDLLHRIRVASALASTKTAREDIVAIRLLAIANLANVYPETVFQQKISQPDSDEPRQFQLPTQLAELIQPQKSGEIGVPREIQILALTALDSLTMQKSKSADVISALSVNVNHGVLFYVLRKVVSELSVENADAPTSLDDEYRDALFGLLINLPGAQPRTGDSMVSAGIFEILVEILNLRTPKAERCYNKVLEFLNMYVYHIRDAFQALVTAKGLDAVANLTSYEVESSFQRASTGSGIPEAHKTQYTDYQIPWHQQQALRQLLKFLNHMLSHTSANFDRMLRNLIDSPQLLGALRKIVENGRVFGSHVWSNAVSIMTNFIHHEPTSFAVIAEAGLSNSFLESVTQKPIPPRPEAPAEASSSTTSTADTSATPAAATVTEVERTAAPGNSHAELVIQSKGKSAASGILPNADAILSIPAAFGAICLNESGMETFRRSGALEAFFQIFESPSHIKALDNDADAAASIGNSFDELVRHHPPLKDAVLASITTLVKRIASLCYKHVESSGVGTKLLIEGENGKAIVSGGRSALLGEWRHTYRQYYASIGSNASDVEMEDAEGTNADQPLSIDEITEIEDPKSGPTTSQYITVVCQFLGGFFTNHMMCSAFAESDAVEYLLDFTTIPSLPYNANDDGPGNLIIELERVVQPLVEQKPHLILPSLLKRALSAVEDLEPFLEHENEDAFFAPFTLSSFETDGDMSSRLENGTKFAKALVSVHVLCSLLSFAFQGQMFNQRGTHNIYSQVNLSDMYARLIDGLGRLHRSCLWEEVVLSKHMPPSWDKPTRAKGLSWNIDGDELPSTVSGDALPSTELTGSAHVEPPEISAGTNSGEATSAATEPEPLGQEKRKDEQAPDENSMYFKNTRVLRFLLSKVPTSIHPFIQNLGRILLYRRTADSYQRQCSFIVAHQIAKACLDQLTFSPTRQAPSAKDRYPYWISIFGSISRLLIDDTMERGHPAVLTLVLDCFKKQGGFGVLEDVLKILTDEVSSITPSDSEEKLSPDVQAIQDLALGGIKTILEFYSQIINAKHVQEASQTNSLQSSRVDRDREKPDYFLTAQFLVELRCTVLRPVMSIWSSDLMDKATTSIVKSLMESLKIILEGEQEAGAFKRGEKSPQRSKLQIRAWKPRSDDYVKRLEDEGFEETIAREALYRCNDNQNLAKEYCTNLKNSSRATRNPIPPYEVTAAKDQSRERQHSENGPSSTAEDHFALAPEFDMVSEPSEPTEHRPSSSAAVDTTVSASQQSTAGAPEVPYMFRPGTVQELSPSFTIDDLDEERSELRKSLVDRALEILNTHDNVTFELSDLITSAAAKSSDPSTIRSEVGATLLQFLVSLQIEEDFRPNVKKIAACAHLLALVLQNKSFYEACLDELKENFSTLLSFVKIFPGQSVDEPSPWISHVLLIMEKLLAEDCEPSQIEWSPPSAEEDLSVEPSATVPEPIVSFEDKTRLFETLVDILPRIGKDETLAHSITRVLCILTRYREIATRLSERRNIQRLFLMAKQLAGHVSDKLQATFMQVLRHIVEDDETIRNIMGAEIQSMFESRNRGQLDTTQYVRNMYHFALRAPEIFIEVTNEKLTLQRYDSNQRPQHLSLKKDDKTDEPLDRNVPAGEQASAAKNNSEQTSLTVGGEKLPDTVEKGRQTESTHPVVEHPAGVIHYLLCELLAYKDVEDKEVPTSAQEKPKESGNDDIVMANGDVPSTPSTPAEPNETVEPKKIDKPEFKADEHPIYMYRCFILQSLAELLASYNKSKIEFINFSRKADPYATTPSKPRSAVLNYLLNTLVPVNTLNHDEDVGFRKRYGTSTWAISVIVSLCSRTEEKPSVLDSDNKIVEEASELTYVRRFVLEHALRAFKEASTSNENLDVKYSRLLNLADLFSKILQGRQLVAPSGNNSHLQTHIATSSAHFISRLMYEKNFIPALTSAIADIDLNYPNAKRAVKYILRPLQNLTSTAVELSITGTVNTPQAEEDEISSAASSVSDADEREQTPDLFRNSTLAMFEPSRGEESDTDPSDDEDEDGDEIYDDEYDEYGEEMDYDEDMEHDGEDVISEPDEELEGMEGLPGDIPMNVELEIEHDDMDDDEDDDDDDDEDLDEEDEGIPDEDDEDAIDEVMEELEELASDDDEDDGEEVEEGEDDDDEWSDEEGADYPGQRIDNMAGSPLGRLARAFNVTGGHADMLEGLDAGDLIEMEQEFLEDDMQEDEDEDDEDDYAEGFYYDPDEDDDEDGMGLPPGAVWEAQPMHHRHHHHHHNHAPPLARQHHIWQGDRSFVSVPPYRSHRAGGNLRGNDDGANPLLHRSGRPSTLPSGPDATRPSIMTDFLHHFDPSRPPPVSLITNLINAFGSTRGLNGGAVRVQIGQDGVGSHWTIDVPPFPGSILYPGRQRSANDLGARATRDDPVQAVAFTLATTASRWQEEARLLFGGAAQVRADRVTSSILKLLVPPAMEAAKRKAKELMEKQARKAKEEQEAREREQKEREEREAREKKEREEREAAEAAEAEAAAARAREEASQSAAIDDQASVAPMEGVQSDGPSAGAETTPAQPTQRITTTIRGREVDITELGIDMEYLEALPDELRQEVLMQQVAERRSQAAAAGEPPTDISPEFLEALPEDIRAEILQQEAADRRRRDREEARRRAAVEGPASAPRPAAEEMDAASFLASLDPGLRQAVLMDQDEDMLAQLPYEIAAEARALDHRRLNQYGYENRFGNNRVRSADRNAQSEGKVPEKPRPKPVVQMLDKSGVATLLRLMFIPQQGSAKDTLRAVLVNVCKNRQNRAEVISILLNILQDGTTDMNAVERSFAQLSLRAKQPVGSQKTPTSTKKLANSHIASLSDMSPLMVVQQCISTLNYLVHFPGSHMSSFFLSEHEVPSSVKARLKGKGKAKDNKANRYPLNALLSLLDRKMVIESSTVMEQLSILLQMITSPLQALLKKEKEKTSEESEKTATTGREANSAPAEPHQHSEDAAMDGTGQQPAATDGETAAPSASNETDKMGKVDDASTKKSKTLVPPEVPEYNLRLVVNILAARECSSKTFRETLSVINNLSAIPEAKEIFGKELIDQALGLGRSILLDLGELTAQIASAKSGTDVQGMALSKFSPASSDQAKLLRVLTALDYLFDPKRTETPDKPANPNAEGLSPPQKEDILTTLFENPTFGSLWGKLSECLSAIRQRGNMFNVATILLPLIEVLMVVCRNTTLKDVPLAKSHSKDFALSSPPPESRMESLFFTFTEEHRKILNDLVRHNPKLMSGSFSLLVKNSKVLEFDNKRNYFNRRIHMRGTEVRQPHQPLQLSVRREQVFLDSFKSLYFKNAEEMKYGKLSIRFHGEEGVDAGGVTREWFQALSRQMFNPDYALFIPVASDRTTFHPNRLSAVNQEHLMFFKFIGRIIGKALYENRVLDCHFSRAVYKRILGKPVGIKDMESLDLDYYKSLLWMLENDITDIITETFSVQTEAFGEEQIIDLIPDGRNIPVTEENKHEYVRLVVEYRLTGSVQEQLENFLKGFHDIIPADLVSIFNEQELELLISGLPDIDVDDWKNNTEYHNYTAAAPQIQWFWRAVRSFDKEERAKLLQFVTGTSKVPLNGFKELEGMNGFSKFNIHRDYGNKDRLPSSHTCFNQLDLPEYPSYEKLREQLYTAITAGSEYFGFA